MIAQLRGPVNRPSEIVSPRVCGAEAASAVLHRDRHAEHANVEEAGDDPVGDVLILVDLVRWMFSEQILIELRKKRVTPYGLFARAHGIWKEQVFAKVAPEQILYRTHRRGIWTEHLLGRLDLLAVFVRDILRAVGNIRGAH